MTRRLALVVAAAAVLLSCKPQYRLEPRFVAVHNAMSAMGLVQTGPISEGSLVQGKQVRFDLQMDAGRCYTLLALGHEGVRDVDVIVVDQTGEEIAKDMTRDPQAVVQACPARTGAHRVSLKFVDGSGAYALAMWSTSIATTPSAEDPQFASESVRGTCSSPIDITLGELLEGDTRHGLSAMDASCSTGHAKEQVFRLQVDRMTQVSALAKTTFDGSLYVQRECGSRASEIVCNDDAPNATRSSINATLKPGTYFVVVDGYGSEGGAFELLVEGSPLRSVDDVCADAQPLRFGRGITGDTQGSADYFQASCASGGRSSDRVFRLKVSEPSRVRIRQQTDHDGALYLRSVCADPKTELACNDDFQNPRSALIRGILEPGDYYVFVDGFAPNQSGTFSLVAHRSNVEGMETDADECEAPGVVNSADAIHVDTLTAHNDFSGSCGGAKGADVAYQVDVSERSRLRVLVSDSEFEGAVYVRRSCGDSASELACESIASDRRGVIDRVVAPGSYFVIVDGADDDEFGAAKLEVRVDQMQKLASACRAAPRLTPGTPVSGTTRGSEDLFQTSCAGGARSGDRVYRVYVPRKSLVKFTLSAQYDSSLHLRRDCLDTETTIACNDDHGDSRHSRILQVLEKGTYYLVVDGFRTGNQGDFDLEMEMLRMTSAP